MERDPVIRIDEGIHANMNTTFIALRRTEIIVGRK